MAEPDSTTPVMQIASLAEKTITCHLLDKLRSHLSCMGAGRNPTFYGAADVSGR